MSSDEKNISIKRRGPGNPNPSGRPKGSKNIATAELRRILASTGDAQALFERLYDLAMGRPFETTHITAQGREKAVKRRPTAQESLTAIQIIMKKLIPDLQAVRLEVDPDEKMPSAMNRAELVAAITRAELAQDTDTAIDAVTIDTTATGETHSGDEHINDGR